METFWLGVIGVGICAGVLMLLLIACAIVSVVEQLKEIKDEYDDDEWRDRWWLRGEQPPEWEPEED